MAQTIFDSADALGAATARLTEAQRAQIRAVPHGDGRYEVIGDAAALAAITGPASAEVLRAYAADKRWRVETGGITVGGAAIDTDRASQAMITGAYAWSEANPGQNIAFKAGAGFVTLSAAEVEAIANAVGAHVQAAFATEAAVDAAITAGTITDFAAIDAADWPA